MLSHESGGAMNRVPCHASVRICAFSMPSRFGGSRAAAIYPYTKRYEYAPKGATLQYNPYRKQRELVGPGETLQYNPYTRKREYAPEGAMPRYNPYTKQRELVGPD